MHERNGIDERKRGSPPPRGDGFAEPATTPGRESLAWIRALANAWEDDRHQDLPEELEGYPSVSAPKRSQ